MLMREGCNKEKFIKVRVCGIECDLSDMRIDRSIVPESRYQYEVAEDDDSGSDPARVQRGGLVNFFETLICDVPLSLGCDGVLLLYDSYFVYL